MACTQAFTSSKLRSTLARTSIVSAVPEADVIARDEVFGMSNPNAAIIGMTTSETRLPIMPPRECLSTTMDFPQATLG